MWTDKYKPKNAIDIIGQDLAVGKVKEFVRSWKPGKGILIHGPTGCGKTALVEAIANEMNYQIVSLNASDKRSPDEIERLIGQPSKQKALFHKGKIILIDEVDTISGRDRGSGAAIIQIIKESQFPVFLIAINPWNPKIRTIKTHCEEAKFKKVHMYDIMKRLKHICEQEKIEAKGNSIRVLSKWSGGDLRSAISDLQTATKGSSEFDESHLEFLGYRERSNDIFSSLQIILKSRNVKAGRKAIRECGKDSDEVFAWVETNLPYELVEPQAFIDTYDLLSKADIMRRRVFKMQNWRFKAIMADLLAGVSLFKGEKKKSGFFMYKPPDKFMLMGKTKAKRALRAEALKTLGKHTHCSRQKAQTYLPYLKIITKKNKKILQSIGWSDEETKVLK